MSSDNIINLEQFQEICNRLEFYRAIGLNILPIFLRPIWLAYACSIGCIVATRKNICCGLGAFFINKI